MTEPPDPDHPAIGEHDEPMVLLDRAAAAGLDTVRELLDAAGCTDVHIVVLIHAHDVPAGEPTGNCTGHGFDDAEDLFENGLWEHYRQGMEAVGVPVARFEMPIGGQG